MITVKKMMVSRGEERWILNLGQLEMETGI